MVAASAWPEAGLTCAVAGKCEYQIKISEWIDVSSMSRYFEYLS